MASTTFTNGTVIASTWLNDVNTVTYTDIPTIKAANWVTSGRIQAGAVLPAKLGNSGSELGMRNRLINGDFRIWQRGTSFTNVSSGTYTADRFVTNSTGTNLSITQSTDTPSPQFPNSLKMMVPVGSTTNSCLIRQYIEQQNLYEFAGKRVVLTGWVKSSQTALKTVCSALNATGGTAITQNFIVTANTWTKFNYEFTSFGSVTAWTGSPTSAGCAIDIGFSDNQSLTTSDYLNVTGLQIEVGYVGTYTPFEFRPYGTELALCQRYYQQWNSNQFFGSGVFTSTTIAYVVSPLGAYMRAQPTVNTTLANLQLIGTSNITPTVLNTIYGTGSQTVGFAFTVSGATAGQAATAFTNTTTFSVSAEL